MQFLVIAYLSSVDTALLQGHASFLKKHTDRYFRTILITFMYTFERIGNLNGSTSLVVSKYNTCFCTPPPSWKN